jgi:hypothetical protein
MKTIFTFIYLVFCGFANIAQVYTVSSSMNGANEVPSVESEGSGTLTGTYDASLNEITLSVTYVNLNSGLTASHLHKAATGLNGGDIISLNPSTGSNSGSISGTFTIQEIDEADLIAGNVYVNLHSTTSPGGEIRGQLSLTLPPPAASKELEVSAGDIFIKDNTRGVIMKSPNGSCFRIQVSDSGILTATALTCP